MECYRKKSVSLDTGGGVKVLSEKTENDKNFQNDRLGPETIIINPPI